MRTEILRLWVTGALAVVLAGATVAVYQTPGVGTDSAPAAGALLFQAKGCTGCHSIAGVAESASLGPELTRVSQIAAERVPGMSAEAYLTQSIRDPWAFTVSGFPARMMPVFELSDAEVASIVEYLLSPR